MNLCLSMTSRCNFDCIYCPSNRGGRLRNTDMSPTTLECILKKYQHEQVDKIELSENGEFLLHPHALEYIARLREAFPDTMLSLYSNFSMMNQATAKTIIEGQLINRITASRDEIRQSPASENLEHFIELRDAAHSPISISIAILTPYRYIETIMLYYQAYPQKYTGEHVSVHEEAEIVQYWRNKIAEQDHIYIPGTFAWAERDYISKPTGTCPLLEKISQSHFIAPNGDVYPCCYDAGYNIILGNIHHDPVEQIEETKQQFIGELKAGIFHYPCTENWSCISRPGRVVA